MVMPKVNKDLLPIKGHYFLFNAGTAPLVPFLPTYAKQLGFSAYVVGIIYSFLPIFSLLCKPLLGAIADRFQSHKFIFILFQVVMISAFSGLYFLPNISSVKTVNLSCGDGASFFHVCNTATKQQDNCSYKFMSEEISSPIAECKMNCQITTEDMWQTVCRHWIPNHCFEYKPKLNFISNISKQAIRLERDCAIFPITSIQTAVKDYYPKCPAESTYLPSCNTLCPDRRIDMLLEKGSLGNYNTNLKCLSEETYLSKCNIDLMELKDFVADFANETGDTDCNTICNVNTEIDYSNICNEWKMDDSLVCQPYKKTLPYEFSFIGNVPLEKTLEENDCTYFRLKSIMTNDGFLHYPQCPRVNGREHFDAKCQIDCDNENINNIIASSDSNKLETNPQNGSLLWSFILLMSLNWIGMAVVVSIADAICFEILGERGSDDYGHQRLWGSVGWGLMSVATGYLIDTFSDSSEIKNYAAAFALMLIFLTLDIVVSLTLKSNQKNISTNMFKNIGVLFSSWQSFHFFVWTIVCGMCTGLLWQFLFWHLENLADTGACDTMPWMKTLQGIIGTIQTFGGEVPFFFLSGWFLRKLGHLNSMTLVLAGIGVRFILYSVLTNPWWTLPIELFQGLAFGMAYSTMISYANIISPVGIEATVIGLVGAVFEGIGVSLGSLVGGFLVESQGTAMTFRIFGLVALSLSIVNGLLVYFDAIGKRPIQEYSSIIRYGGRNEGIEMLEEVDPNEGRE